ncbi:MAG: hypothetical protein ACK4TG_06270 [Thermaurantiacus sp.]
MRMSLALLCAVALAAPASGQHARDGQTSAGHAGHAVDISPAFVDFDREAAGATEHQRAMAPLDKGAHVRLIEAHGFRLVEDVAIPTLRQNFMLRFVRE